MSVNHKSLLVLVVSLVMLSNVHAERIKDLASVAGVRSNQLIGYGLVVGLNGTGDKTTFTQQSFKNMLKRFGITLPVGFKPQIKNVAAVALHADLPPFYKPGQTLDVTVSSIGDASSLRGGTLLIAPMKGLDSKIYAMAQGSVVVSGLGASGKDGSKITVNVPSVGRIPNGAIVERAVPSSFSKGEHIVFNLKQPDFTTAKRMADVINRFAGPNTAIPVDSASVKVSAPVQIDQRIYFLSVLENIHFLPAESAAKIVLNSRTGTIVIGDHVRVGPAAVTHGSLTVTISENTEASQPGAFATGTTQVLDQSDVSVSVPSNPMFLVKSTTSLQDIVNAINGVGAAPADLMAILEALKAVGALHAELVVI